MGSRTVRRERAFCSSMSLTALVAFFWL